MARKTIRVDIPTGSPDKLIKLAKDIDTKNNEVGTTPVIDVDATAATKSTANTAGEKRTLAASLAAQAQTLNEDASNLLGLGNGQNAQTPNTVLFDVTGYRDDLLKAFRGNEEKLSEYGFSVVVGEAKSPKKKTPTP